MSPKTMKLLAKPMLFAAAIIWGTSFFIMKNALDALPPFYLLAIRFTAGAVLLALIAWKKWQIFTWDHLWRGAVMGAFLFLAYSIQTFGLTLTTPSKNAFLTAVYCVLVPFLSWAVIRVRPDRFNIAAALLCVTGVGFVSLTEELTINAGDLLTLVAAFFYASHIVAVARVSPGKDITLLTVFQFAFAGLYAWIGGSPAYGVSLCHGHHRGPPVSERGPGLVRPRLRLGHFVPGVGVWRAVLRAVLWRPGDRPAPDRIWTDIRGRSVLRNQVFISE